MSFGQHYHDEDERRKWQNPEEILEEVGLREGHTFIDIGCGEGFFSLAAARMVGPQGRVVGLDINGTAIKNLKERMTNEGMHNSSFVVSKAEEAELCDACADFVFFGIDLHDFEDPEKVLVNARKMLKDGGKLVDLDWKKKVMSKGPPVWIRFSEAHASKLIEDAGFKIESVNDSGEMHYIIIARKRI